MRSRRYMRKPKAKPVRHSLGHTLRGCECDNTHDAAGTVCQWCWGNGRRKPSDPPVGQTPPPMPSVRVDNSVVIEATNQQVVQFSQILPLDKAIDGWPGETFLADVRRDLERGQTFKASLRRSGVILGVTVRLLKPGE